MTHSPLASLLAFALTAAAPAQDSPLVFLITEGSTIGFVGSKVTGSHTGGFREFDGTFTLTGPTPEGAAIHVTIDMRSTWTDADRLTSHLMTADFFEVETYPSATFNSTAVTASGDAWAVTGELDLHGVTNEIIFPATIAVAGDTLTAQASFEINRFDWGIAYAGRPDDLIRPEVAIDFDITATAARDE